MMVQLPLVVTVMLFAVPFPCRTKKSIDRLTVTPAGMLFTGPVVPAPTLEAVHIVAPDGVDVPGS